MDHYTPSTYGDRIAGIHDEWHPAAGDAEQVVDVLADLAGNGSATKHISVYEPTRARDAPIRSPSAWDPMCRRRHATGGSCKAASRHLSQR
jgi:hypothetical protein